MEHRRKFKHDRSVAGLSSPNRSNHFDSGHESPYSVWRSATGTVTVLVVAADGVIPVAGASVQFTSLPAVGFSACSGGANCTLLTDQSGIASTFMMPLSVGAMTVIAKLAPATYPVPQQVQVVLVGTSSQLDLSLLTPSVWIAQGATVTLPLSARVLSNGSPVTGSTVNYQITQGF